MLLFAGIVRKSPTNKGIEESVDIQKDNIISCCKRLAKNSNWRIHWFVDIGVKGDDPNRPELLRLFYSIHDYNFAVADVVDRYARFWKGIEWFMRYFATDDGNSTHKGCKLIFARDMSSLYDSDGRVNGNAFFMFNMYCAKAHCELLDIRRRTSGGRDKLRGTAEWKKKYAGRKKGSKNKK